MIAVDCRFKRIMRCLSPTALVSAPLSFLWQSKRGSWHMLVHNMAAVAPGVNGPIAHGYSPDGRDWTLSTVIPANCTLSYTDGTSIELPSCGNRPQLAFDDDGAPIVSDCWTDGSPIYSATRQLLPPPCFFFQKK